MPDQTTAALDCIENLLSRLRRHRHRNRRLRLHHVRLHLQSACLRPLRCHHCLPHYRNL